MWLPITPILRIRCSLKLHIPQRAGNPFLLIARGLQLRSLFGGDREIWTLGLLLARQVLYQTKLYPQKQDALEFLALYHWANSQKDYMGLESMSWFLQNHHFPKNFAVYVFNWSGWSDSNTRPHGPETS